MTVSFNANRFTNPHCSKTHFSNHRVPLKHKLNQTTTTRFSWIVWTAPESENRQTHRREKSLLSFPVGFDIFDYLLRSSGWRAWQRSMYYPSALFLFMEIVSRWGWVGNLFSLHAAGVEKHKRSWQNWLSIKTATDVPGVWGKPGGKGGK